MHVKINKALICFYFLFSEGPARSFFLYPSIANATLKYDLFMVLSIPKEKYQEYHARPILFGKGTLRGA